MINKELEITIEATMREAQAQHFEYISVEHILLAVTYDELGIDIISNCGGDIEGLKKMIRDYLGKNIPKIPSDNDSQPQPTIGFQRVIQRALLHVQSCGKQVVDSGDLLASIFLEGKDSHAVHLLEKEGISHLDVLNYISHGISKVSDDVEIDDEEEPDTTYPETHRSAIRDPLKLFTVNLIEKAKNGEIDPLIGRKLEIERTIQILSRRQKNNPIFVGEPGVGKTAIVEGLALKIYKEVVPEHLKGSQIFLLDMGGLLAGTKYRGDFEARLKSTIDALGKIPKSILFIDEIHTVVGAGATSGGSMDASNILKPVLASGKLRCMGSSTYEEFKNYFEKDRALSRRFQKIEIQEPTVKETIDILKGLRTYYEEFHGVSFTENALRKAAELSAKYINDKFLPDKAIDVIDEAGASIKLLPSARKGRNVGPHEIEKVVARIARIPSQNVTTSETDKLHILADALKSTVFGQDSAIDALVSSIRRSRAGLGSPEKPIGSFLFAGPTGVGKTEISKQLALTLGVKFIRFDMSEYMEKHTVSRLIGSPPGYVGFDQGGLLTDDIRKNPYSVLLMDEIEKAHPDIFDILLQVMDHATLTDNNGKKADFRNVIFIMTSNAGARDMDKNTIGFGDRTADTQLKSLDAINKAFSPEFKNRLDDIILFKSLTTKIMEKIVTKFINELKLQLSNKKVDILLSEKARIMLAKKGHDPRYGARPLGRIIQTEIKDLLSEEILFGSLKKGGKVHIDLNKDKLEFKYDTKP